MTPDEAAPEAPSHYRLSCPSCGGQLYDDGLILECGKDHGPALLRTSYIKSRFKPDNGIDGVFRYHDWLPVRRTLPDAGSTVVYRGHRLAESIGLSNLWIAFNGYWPERDATLETATFKELEAHTVLARLPQAHSMLSVASAGNTGAAFALSCSRHGIPCLIIIPQRALHRFKFRDQLNPCVRIVSVPGEYPDAIAFADRIAATGGFYGEGGAKNVGRRDGLGTVLLSAFEEIGTLPDFYFQAVGSGTGGISVHEAALRLRQATDHGAALPRLMLCQNMPFAPIYESWQLRQRSLISKTAEDFRRETGQVRADELTNWRPPYSLRGGVYDALAESGGDVLVAGNLATQAAMDMFLDTEGIDIEPAAGVALACLRDAVIQGYVPVDSNVLLNVTGGGRKRLEQDFTLFNTSPDVHLTAESLASGESVDRVLELVTARLTR
jgi:cysteate synthase